ncbi:MAG: hypothetical protein JST81_06940 [Bacteroidetes bacterium]|nr:hypothetical protein [Bacteroidota bacterium]
MNKLFATICLLTFHYGSQAQYYYKDIVTNKLLTADMQAYKQKKIHKIILNSYEDDGSPSDGFLCEKTISRDYRTSELFTRSNISAISLFTSEFNDKLQLVSSTDSSSISATRNHYSYDASGRLTKVESSVKSNDDDFTNEIIEEHIYYYSEAGALQYMMRVKDRRDSTKILFSTDEKNNVTIEKDTKTGRKYYYYYDDKNRLTDIAHTTEFREKTVADYIFEYDASGMLKQMTVTEEGRGKERNDNAQSFVIWRYVNEDGLRIKEGLFSQRGKLIGSVEYEYKK